MVDNTIATQIRPFQMPDLGQIYGNIQNIQMNRMRMAEAQETAQERNALRGLLSSGVDPYSPEGLSQVRRVAPMLAAPFEQAAGQRAYQAAQAGRLRAQTQTDQIKVARDLLSGVSNQAQWDAWRASTVAALPQYDNVIPREFSPQNVQRMAEGAEGLIRRATEAAAAARPNEFERALAAANIRPGTPEFEAAMRGRAEYLRGVRPTPPRGPTVVSPGSSVIDESGRVIYTAPERDQAPISVAPGNSVIDRSGRVIYTAPERAQDPAPISVAPGNSVIDRSGRVIFTAPERPETPQVIAGPDGRPITVLPRSNTFTFAQEAAAGAPVAPVDLRRPQTAAPPANMLRLNAAPPAQPTNMMLPNAAAATLAAGPAAVPAAPTTFEEAQAAREARDVRVAGARVGAEETARQDVRSATARRQEQEQLNRAISELERISAPGGLLERSTGGGLNAIVDRFFDFFNAPTSGAVAIGSLQPVADVVLKMVPRFEGPQSDRDTQSYREAAGRLADPTVPNETRLAAAREILRLFRARQNQFDYNPTTGATPSPGSAQPARTGQRPAPPSVGDVVDGYRFRGGDPSNPRNWERQ